MKRYPATFFVLLMSVFVQLLCLTNPGLMETLAFRPADGILGWLGILTYQFDHTGWGHLIGNFSFGLPFMLFLEHRLGRVKMMEYYVACGITSAMLQLMLEGPQPLVGSSGSVMGCMVGACMAFGDSTAEHILALSLLLCVLIPQLYMAPLGGLTGVAYYCHIGGALSGLLLSHRIHRATKER